MKKESIINKDIGIYSIASLLFLFLWLLVPLTYGLSYRNQVNQLIDVTNFKIMPIWLFLSVISFVFYLVAKSQDGPVISKKISFWLQPFNISLFVLFIISLYIKRLLFPSIIIGIIITFIRFLLVYRDDFDKYNQYIGVKTEEDNIVEFEQKPGDFKIGEMLKRNKNSDGVTPEGEDDYILSGKSAIVPLKDRFLHFLVLGPTGSGKTSQTLIPMVLQDFLSDNFKYQNINVVQMGQIIIEPKGDFAKVAWAIGKIQEEEKKINYIGFILSIEKLFNEKISELSKYRQSIIDKGKGVALSKEESRELKKLESLYNDKDRLEKIDVTEQVSIYARLTALSKKQNGTTLSDEDQSELENTEKYLKRVIYIKNNLGKVIDLDIQKLSNYSTYSLFRYASLLSDVASKPDLADKTWNDILNQKKDEERDVFLLFDPSAKKSSYFNPLYGKEEVASATVTQTLVAFMDDSSSYFQQTASTLLQNAIILIKRVFGNDATLIHLQDVLTNAGGRGEQIVRKIGTIDTDTEAKAIENRNIQEYFSNDYYASMKGVKGVGKTYEHSSSVRANLSDLLKYERIRNILCPPPGVGTDIDFDKILKVGDKVALSTNSGLSPKITGMIGKFLMLQLQSAVFRRDGKEDTRIPVVLYIDEFQEYATSDFEQILTQGRSYAISATMATQTTGLIEQKAGSGLVQNIRTNARNMIIYPGGSVDDTKYFVSLFGTTEESVTKRSVSQAVEEEQTVFNKATSMFSESKSGGGPRESISEDIKSIDRFTQAQMMYGPNQKNRNINANDSFGTVFFRIVANNNVQLPATAKIEYIPKDIKSKSDKLIATYEELNNISNQDNNNQEEEIQDTIDPLDGEETYKPLTIKELTKETTFESDPAKLVRGLKKVEDLSTPNIDNLQTIEEIEPMEAMEVSGFEDIDVDDPNLSIIEEDLSKELEIEDFGEISI